MPDSSQGLSGLAAPYAVALFELAVEQDVVDSVEAELGDIVRMIAESDELARMVRSPVLLRETQAQALRAVLKEAGAGSLVRNFAGVLARNRRLAVLPAIVQRFHGLAADRRDEVEAYATSASELPESLVAQLKDTLSSAWGRKVALHTTVNPDLLGGLVVRVGSTLVDGSLRTRLHTLGQTMKGTV